MNQIVSFNLCTITDMELLKKVDEMTDNMYETREIPSRHVPARPNDDYDLLVGELVKRFYELIKEGENPELLNK
jgi:predicted transcriptional regulator